MAETRKSSSGGGRKRRSSSGSSKSSSSGSSKSSSRKNSSSGSSKSSSSGSRQSSNGRSPREIVRDATEQLQELIGRPIEAVLGIEKDEDGDDWAVSVEVLELERVPNTTDVLGKYEVKVDADGDVVAARRTRRYLRSQSGED